MIILGLTSARFYSPWTWLPASLRLSIASVTHLSVYVFQLHAPAANASYQCQLSVPGTTASYMFQLPMLHTTASCLYQLQMPAVSAKCHCQLQAYTCIYLDMTIHTYM